MAGRHRAVSRCRACGSEGLEGDEAALKRYVAVLVVTPAGPRRAEAAQRCAKHRIDPAGAAL